MGRKMTQGRMLLEGMAAIEGEEALLEAFQEQWEEGLTPKQVAEGLGIVVSALWQWLKPPHRMKVYREALLNRADALAHESLQDVNDTDPDHVQVAALKASHKLKIASKWDRANYGERPTETGPLSVNVYVDRAGALTIDAEPVAPQIPATPGELAHDRRWQALSAPSDTFDIVPEWLR
jgi:hypothetical protein